MNNRNIKNKNKQSIKVEHKNTDNKERNTKTLKNLMISSNYDKYYDVPVFPLNASKMFLKLINK